MEWIDAEWPTRYSGEYGTTSMPLSALFNMPGADRNVPAVVYIYATLDDDEKAEKLERKLFGSEDLLVASRFFRLFRINERDVPDRKIRDRYLKKLPAFLFMDARGNIVDTVAGRVSARALLGRMNRLYKAHFEGRMSTHVKKFHAYLKDVAQAEDRLANAVRRVEALEERLDKNDSKSAARQLEEKKVEVAKLRKELDEILAKGEQLLPRPKADIVRR